MREDLLHVYLMPGMAANPKIFEYIKLPEDKFEIHYLSWIIPKNEESLEAYAHRMCEFIIHDNIVLLGVSFGGVLVQEMAKIVQVKKLIIVSSVKSKDELPTKMRIAKVTRAYKLVPTQLVSKLDVIADYAFGANVRKRLELYKMYLSVNDSRYLSWAIEQMVCWNQDVPDSGLIHIHGDKDEVFPIKHIKDCMVLKGGTHIMIINKYKWFNENLPRIISETS
ncbi:alpha/beta hydrolase family protein [Gaetbulibacter saemankumensis]|uniref:alpha/beta hydrolase n=1 Tax=Gaetbulibacter saemankumensis TaxID=311208 RepID=UPI0003FE7B9B|nr:alpha/beta hydrolase [Gaetbulibacter saemankumensis]